MFKTKIKVWSCLHREEISRSRYFPRFSPSGVHLLSPTKLRLTEREQMQMVPNVLSITHWAEEKGKKSNSSQISKLLHSKANEFIRSIRLFPDSNIGPINKNKGLSWFLADVLFVAYCSIHISVLFIPKTSCKQPNVIFCYAGHDVIYDKKQPFHIFVTFHFATITNDKSTYFSTKWRRHMTYTCRPVSTLTNFVHRMNQEILVFLVSCGNIFYCVYDLQLRSVISQLIYIW